MGGVRAQHNNLAGSNLGPLTLESKILTVRKANTSLYKEYGLFVGALKYKMERSEQEHRATHYVEFLGKTLNSSSASVVLGVEVNNDPSK